MIGRYLVLDFHFVGIANINEGQQLVSDTCGQPATQQADSSVLFFAKILLNPLTRSLPLRPPLDQCLIAQHQMYFT